MGTIATAVRHLIAAGVSGDDLVCAIEEMEETQSAAPQRTARQERNRRYYEKKASEKRLNKTIKTDSDASAPLSPSLFPLDPPPQTPPPIIPQNPSSIPAPQPPEGERHHAGFERFWSEYPNKVGKRDAEKSFSQAIKRADLETIMTGLSHYRAKQDDRPWCNPATWLNQDRWADRPAMVIPQARGSPPRKSSFAAHQDAVKRNLAGYDDEPELSYIDHRA